MDLLLAIALAQMPWTTNLPERGVALDILRPKFQFGGTSLTSVAAYVSGRFPTGAIAIRFELPLAYFSSSSSLSGTSFTFGNPYVGLETGADSGLGFEAGLRGPAASDNESASELGAFSDITRYEAFLPNSATVSGRARWRVHDAGGFTFDAGGGPSIIFPTKGGGDAELILHHHMTAGYRGRDAWVSVGFGGWTFVTQDAGGVGQRTINEVAASLGFAGGNVRPAVHIIVPLDDDYNAIVGVVLGFGVAVPVK